MNVLKITSGAMKIVDPCMLGGDKWETAIKVPNGAYAATINYVNIKAFGDDNKTGKEIVFCTKPHMAKLKAAKWESVGSVPVDSGLTGVFDGSLHISGLARDEWYEDEVVGMYADVKTFFDGKGVISKTAFGDGPYDILVAKSGNVVIAVKIVFVSDEDIEYYNTPTLSVDGDVLIFHSSEPMYPLARIKGNGLYDSFVRLPESDTDIIGGIVRYEEYKERPALGSVVTEQVKLNTNDFAKLFDLMSISLLGGNTAKLRVDGEFIITSSKQLGRGGTLEHLKKSNGEYNFKSTSFKASKGKYAVVAEKIKGRIVGVSIRKIK